MLESLPDVERVFIQVDRKMFEKTQQTLTGFVLLTYIKDIQTNFGIDWPSVEWKDLRKPLYSALGARLYVLYNSRNDSDDIPQSIENQAAFWRTHYRPDADDQYFSTQALKFENREYNAVDIKHDRSKSKSV